MWWLERNQETRRFWNAVLPGGVSTMLGSFLYIFWKTKQNKKINPTLLLIPSAPLTPWLNAIILSYQASSPNKLFSHPLKQAPKPLLGQLFLGSCVCFSISKAQTPATFLPPPHSPPLGSLSLPLCQGSSSKLSTDPSAPHPSCYCSCLCVLAAPSARPPQQISCSTTSRPQLLCSPFSLWVPSRSLFLCASWNSGIAKGQTRDCFSQYLYPEPGQISGAQGFNPWKIPAPL